MVTPPDQGFDRRAVLTKIAATGAVAWVTPVILTKPPVAAGVFTTKCAPGTVTGATTSVVWQTCTTSISNIQVTLNFSGTCPCGGTPAWCAQKTVPTGTVSSSTSSIVFVVGVPYNNGNGGATAVSGQVAMSCVDRDGDIQWARYDWSMTVSDSGGACNSAFSGTTPVLTSRTLFTQTACPLPAARSAGAVPVTAQSAPVGRDLD